jgi:Predicted metal-dependent hydrolase with the TIM-barrel fold
VKDRRIVFIGSNRDATKFRGAKTRIIDLGGPLVPGLTDSHCHIFGIGEREMTLNLEKTNTRDDFLAKVKARIAQTSLGIPSNPSRASRRYEFLPSGLPTPRSKKTTRAQRSNRFDGPRRTDSNGTSDLRDARELRAASIPLVLRIG